MGILLVPLFDTLALVVDLYFKIVVVQVVLYWLLRSKIVSITNKYAQKLVDVLNLLTEPVYKKIRSKVPPFADFDVSPFIVLLVLFFVLRLLLVSRDYLL